MLKAVESDKKLSYLARRGTAVAVVLLRVEQRP
jgi:hypothetical protein